MILLLSHFIVSAILYSLTQAAQAKLPGALAPSTRRTYSVMFKIFLVFLVDILIDFMFHGMFGHE